MKIKANVLKTFLKKLNTNNQVGEALFDFCEEGIKVSSITTDNTIFVNGKLKKTSFSDYRVLGKIAIGNFTKLIKCLETFSDEDVEINFPTNLVSIEKEKRMVELIRPAEEFLEEVNPLKIENFTVKKKINSKILLDSEKMRTYLGEEIFFFTLKDKKLYIQAGEKEKFIETIDFDDENDFKLSFGPPLSNVLACIANKEILFETAKNYPLKLTETDEYMEVSWLVSPREE